MYSLYNEDNNAEFAKRKKERKSKLGYYAGATALGAAGLGAGVRYGGAEYGKRKMKGATKSTPDGFSNQRGAIGLMKSDISGATESVKRNAGRAKDYVGSNWNRPLKVAEDARSGVARSGWSAYNKLSSVAEDARSGVARSGWSAYNKLSSAKMPTKLAAGAAGLAALGGAGYGAYKATKGRKKKRRSLSSLLGR